MKTLFLIILTLSIGLIISGCRLTLQNSNVLEKKNENIASSTSGDISNIDRDYEKKTEFIVLGERVLYENCTNHMLSNCSKFFNELVNRGIMTTTERRQAQETVANKNNVNGEPVFTDTAKAVRRAAVEKYWDYVRSAIQAEPVKYEQLFENIKCSGESWQSCSATGILKKSSYPIFIRFE